MRRPAVVDFLGPLWRLCGTQQNEDGCRHMLHPLTTEPSPMQSHGCPAPQEQRPLQLQWLA
eukprot:3269486-Pyramimonas_sp.AAC.1